MIAMARQDQPAARTLYSFFPESRGGRPDTTPVRENLLLSINGPFNGKRFRSATAAGAIARRARRYAQRADVAPCVHVDALETAPAITDFSDPHATKCHRNEVKAT
jgi:hypothetical protein